MDFSSNITQMYYFCNEISSYKPYIITVNNNVPWKRRTAPHDTHLLLELRIYE